MEAYNNNNNNKQINLIPKMKVYHQWHCAQQNLQVLVLFLFQAYVKLI